MNQELLLLVQKAKALIERREIWLPDLFACVYDILEHGQLWRRIQDLFITALRDPLSLKTNEAQFRARFCERGAWCALESSPELKSVVADALAQLHGASSSPNAPALKLAYVARLVDTYLSGLSIHHGCSIPERLQRYWDALSSADTLTRDMRGRVVPRAVLPRYGNSLAQFFGALTRVSERLDDVSTYRVVPSTLPRALGGALPRVGFVPTVVHEDEVRWGIERGCFTVDLCPIKESVVIERVLRALDWLASEGVDVILMPELTSSEKVRAAVTRWLMSGSGRPFLVLAGSQAVPASSATGKVNRAYVLDSAGFELWTQDKCHQYALAMDVIRQFELEHIYREPLSEIGVAEMEQIAIRDIPGAGRFAVLICEDFARFRPGPQVIQEYGLTVCLTIVLSGLGRANSWTNRQGLNVCQELAGAVLVSNSHALLSRDKSLDVLREDLAAYWRADRSPVHWKPLTFPGDSQPIAYLGTAGT